MATLKQLMDTYKSINKEFRHEFNGETWNVWTNNYSQDGGYPNVQGLTTDRFEEWLKKQLKEYVVVEEKKAVEANNNAMSVRAVLNGR